MFIKKIGLLKFEADNGSNGGQSGDNGVDGGSGNSNEQNINTTVQPQVYEENDLENVMSGFLNLSNDGDRAITMNNIRDTTRNIILERNNLAKEVEKLRSENNEQSKSIGQLYSQLGKKDTVGDENGQTNGATTRNLFDVQKDVLGY